MVGIQLLGNSEQQKFIFNVLSSPREQSEWGGIQFSCKKKLYTLVFTSNIPTTHSTWDYYKCHLFVLFSYCSNIRVAKKCLGFLSLYWLSVNNYVYNISYSSTCWISSPLSGIQLPLQCNLFIIAPRLTLDIKGVTHYWKVEPFRLYLCL